MDTTTPSMPEPKMMSDVLKPFEADASAKLAQDEVAADKAIQEAADAGTPVDQLAGGNMMVDMNDPKFQKAIKKYQKMIKDRAPKHENYRLCHKKCPNFKKCSCFKKEIADQKACWESWHDAENVATDNPPEPVAMPPEEKTNV